MDKFRVLSDLHLDINAKYPLVLDDNNVFTVICGDTSGYPEMSIEWIKENVKCGLCISGNHLPYCNTKDISPRDYRTMDELRKQLAEAFPANSDITYLDVETGTFKKEVDGILFLGSCGYSNMRISHKYWNPTGDQKKNFECSNWNMNDYCYGKITRKWPFGIDNDPSYECMRAEDYAKWFLNAFNAFDKVLNENESHKDPLPVVLLTHFHWIPNYLTHSYYVDNAKYLYRPRDFNWASYASDCTSWFNHHKSIKCYCVGHIHAPEKNYRHIFLDRNDGSKILVVNNARGYVAHGHSYDWNVNTFVNTKTWDVEETPLSAAELDIRKKDNEERYRNLAWLF